MRKTIAELTRISALTASAVAAAGCGSTSLTTVSDDRTPFERYSSYAIEPGPVVTDEAVTAVPDQLAQDRIDDRLGKELAAKGFSPAEPDDAALLITYAARARDVQKVVDSDFGPDLYPFNGDVWVQTYRETTFVVDALDGETHERVWRATARTRNKDFRDPEFVAQIVKKAMKDFPPAESD